MCGGGRLGDMADLIFDGRCGFCTRAVHLVRRLDRRGRIRVHAYQREGVLETFGLTEEQAAGAVWLLDDGHLHSGAAAVSGTLDAALGTRLFLRLHRLPGIRWLQDRVYTLIADNRYRLPGAVPWCEEHPGDCMSAEEIGGSCGISGPEVSGSCGR